VDQLDIAFRQQTLQAASSSSGRSITLENAMKPEPLIAWALNGDPLTRDSGISLCGSSCRAGTGGKREVAGGSPSAGKNRFLGNYQARWYRSLRGVGGYRNGMTIRKRSGWKPRSPTCS